jgi:hypothetical protein
MEGSLPQAFYSANTPSSIKISGSVIPFGGRGHFFSAIGGRLHNTGVAPHQNQRLRSPPIGLGLPGGRPPNKPLWQGHGRPSITQCGSHAMFDCATNRSTRYPNSNLICKWEASSTSCIILIKLLRPMIYIPALPMNI